MEGNGLDFGVWFWVVGCVGAVGLAVFGVLYDCWVAVLERQGHDRGYMAFVVALGSLVTLCVGGVVLGALAGPLVGLVAWGVMVCCFVASGIPMIIGSVRRHVRARDAGERAWRELPEWVTEWLRRGDDDQGAGGEDEMEAGVESGG